MYNGTHSLRYGGQGAGSSANIISFTPYAKPESRYFYHNLNYGQMRWEKRNFPKLNTAKGPNNYKILITVKWTRFFFFVALSCLDILVN